MLKAVTSTYTGMEEFHELPSMLQAAGNATMLGTIFGCIQFKFSLYLYIQFIFIYTLNVTGFNKP